MTDLTPKTHFTVSFASDGTLVGALPSSVSVKRGENVTLPTCTAKRPGYVFDGWLVGTVFHEVGDAITPTDDTVVSAVWLKQSVVFALRPERTYSDVKNFSFKSLTAVKNPDDTTETVFRTDYGVYIENTNGLLKLRSGATYRLSFDIRPDNEIKSLYLFCHKDKTASPESFVFKGIGSATANVWTTVTAEFTVDSYNNVSGNTFQIQISGTNTPYYIRNIVLEGVPDRTVTYTDKDGHTTEIVDLYGTTSAYTFRADLLGSAFCTISSDTKAQIYSANTPLTLTEKNTVLVPYFPTVSKIIEYAPSDGKATVKMLVKEAGIYTVSSNKALTLEADDKIMVYQNIGTLKPLCDALTVSYLETNS